MKDACEIRVVLKRKEGGLIGLGVAEMKIIIFDEICFWWRDGWRIICVRLGLLILGLLFLYIPNIRLR